MSINTVIILIVKRLFERITIYIKSISYLNIGITIIIEVKHDYAIAKLTVIACESVRDNPHNIT